MRGVESSVISGGPEDGFYVRLACNTSDPAEELGISLLILNEEAVPLSFFFFPNLFSPCLVCDIAFFSPSILLSK